MPGCGSHCAPPGGGFGLRVDCAEAPALTRSPAANRGGALTALRGDPSEPGQGAEGVWLADAAGQGWLPGDAVGAAGRNGADEAPCWRPLAYAKELEGNPATRARDLRIGH